MKKLVHIIIWFSLLIGVSACASNPINQPVNIPQEQPAEQVGHDHSGIFPYLGIWFSEDRTSQLIITEAHFYFHDFSSDREVYAQIKGADLVDDVLELRMTNILHSGQQMGFDTPMVTVQYQVSDEMMQIWLGRITLTGGDQATMFFHDAVLNP